MQSHTFPYTYKPLGKPEETRLARVSFAHAASYPWALVLAGHPHSVAFFQTRRNAERYPERHLEPGQQYVIGKVQTAR